MRTDHGHEPGTVSDDPGIQINISGMTSRSSDVTADAGYQRPKGKQLARCLENQSTTVRGRPTA